MFVLNIENFKSWKTKELRLDVDNGVVLISGESGKGKTSILQAIEFAITGKGKKIITRGKSSCKVYLKFHNIEITRTKGPNRLQVTVDDITLEDIDAQCEINNIFGEDFVMTSFIKQKSMKSFLSLTPKDKTMVIRRNCLTELNNIKENCDNSLREAKAKMRDSSISINQLHDVMEGIEKPERVINEKLDGKKEKYINQYIQSLIIKIKNRETRRSRLSTKLQEDRKKLQQHIHNNKNNKFFIDTISEIENEITSLGTCPEQNMEYTSEFLQTQMKRNREYESFKTQSKSYNEMKEEETQRNASISTELEDEISRLEDELSILSPVLHTSITESCKALSNAKKWYEWCVDNKQEEFYLKSLPECLTTFEEQNANLAKKRTRYLCLRESKKCPECNITIVINADGDLTKGQYDLTDNTQKEVYDKKIAIVDKKVKKNKAIIRAINKVYFDCSKSVSEYKDIYSSLVDANDKYTSCSDKIDGLKLKLANCRRENPTLVNLANKLKRIETKLIKPVMDLDTAETHHKELKDFTKRLKTYNRSLENLHKRLNTTKTQIISESTEDKISEFKQLVKDTEINIDINDTEKKTLEENKDGAKTYIEYIKKKKLYDSITDKLELEKGKLGTASREFKCLNRLGKVITKAESITMSNYIKTLNVYIDEYMSAFFPSVAMKAAISTFKTDSKSCVKHQITVIVYHGGEEVDVGSLSGGEYDRLQLAITMAMSRVSNSPIMMLDESISSLDEGTCNTVLKGIKSNTELSKLVILVAHQFIEGNFDSTIEI